MRTRKSEQNRFIWVLYVFIRQRQMESRNSRLVKPGTAGRPTGRSQHRNASKGGRKNSRVAGEGAAYAGGSTTATAAGSSVVSGRGAMSVRTSEMKHVAGGQGFKNMPMGRTTEMFNPAPAKKDGFFLHKRGQGYDGAGTATTTSAERQQQMTMEQLAREGAQQAMAQAAAGSEEDDTTAMSDLNSLQNFSYYGRRFQDRNNRMQESPAASDAVSMSNPTAFPGPQNQAAKRGNNAANDISNDTMSENVSNFTGFYQQNNNTKNQGQQQQQTRLAPGVGPEYQLEEKMNDNLMKQFQPMLSDNVTITKRPGYNEPNPLTNSVSDFSQNNEGAAGAMVGTQSRAQLFAQAKETLMAQQRAQNMAKTASNFNPKTTTKNVRNASGSATRAGNMMKTAQNFMPKKGQSAAKVLPPKLPPRAIMSPAIKSVKGANLTSNKKNNLLSSQNSAIGVANVASQGVITGVKPALDSRDNMYYPNSNCNELSGLNSATNQSEIVYKRGARSISKRRTTNSNQNQNMLNLTTVDTPAHDSSLIAPSQASQRNLIHGPGEEYHGVSKQNLLGASDSKMSLNTEKRREKYVGSCVACQERAVDGHDHSISHSLEERLDKFNKNFNPSGHCKRHNMMGCEKCSMGSSKGSRVSSLESGGFVSGQILQKHRAATRSDIGLNAKAKITKSMTRQMKRPKQTISGIRNSLVQKSLNAGNGSSLDVGQRIRSLPREDSQTIGASTPLIEGFGDVRRSTKNAEVRQLTGKLMQYGKRGNRPSANQLPKPNSFAISEVKMRVSGRGEPTSGVGGGRREDSSDSRGYSEYVNLKGDGRPGQIPNFSRILSAKTAQTSIQRREMQTKLQQRDHSEIKREEIQKLAKEWEGDPHDPAFWQKFEGENNQTNLEKRELMQGQNTKTKQEDVLDKQSNVFKQLKEQDELMSNRDSMLGTQMGFGVRGSIPGQMDHARRSNASFFTNNVLQTHADEPIQTEIDQNEYSMFQQNQLMLQSTKNIKGINGGKRLKQDPSAAVLTDYDIADEVGNQFGQSFRHQLEFRDQNMQDTIAPDSNIDDMKKQLQQQLLESKAPKQVGDMSSVRNQQALFSGQTIKTGVSPAMQVGDLDSSAKRTSAARTHSDATAGFPSAQSKSHGGKKTNDKKPSGFNDQDKDSEDADSFDEEKQKTQVLKDLQMDGSDDENDDKDEEPAKPQATDEVGDDAEHVVSERSDDDEDEQRKKEIDKKTMANVVPYDDWLEARTQKEIERQSQAAMSPVSSKMTTMPKKGVLFGGAELDRVGNMTQLITKSAKKLGVDLDDKDSVGDGEQDRNKRDNAREDLVENIREGTMRNARPKTRGEPSGQTLDIGRNNQQYKEDEQVTTTKANDANQQQQVNQENKSGGNFSSRRRTQNATSSASGVNQDADQLKASTAAKFTPNATQKSPNLNNAVQFAGRTGADHLSSKSPDKTARGLAMIQSKGLITSEGNGNNNRSKASFTNFASSLREDDLMISSSMVDPLEQSKPRPLSKKRNAADKQSNHDNEGSGSIKGGCYQDQLAILEESSSLKSVSPLTENSASRKSNSLALGSSTSGKQRLPKEEVSHQASSMLPPAGKPGLPPKSPFVMKAKKIPDLPTSPKEKAAPNYMSFSGDQPSPKTATILPEVKQSPSRQLESSSVLSPSRQSSSSRKPYHQSPTQQQQYSNRMSPSSRKLQQQRNDERQEMNTSTQQKPVPGVRNQAVHDFLAFEDSDDSDDFGVIIKKQDLQPAQEEKKQYTILPEIPMSPKQEVKLSPPRPSSLSKTPSAQFVPNAQFLRSNPATMPQLTPFDKLPPTVAKTPNTGISSAKVKAIQLANEKKLQTAVAAPTMPIRQNSIDNDSVNDQLNKIDYSQDNEGMSASFYRHHDQWLAMQGTMKTNEYGNNGGAQTPSQPPLQSMGTMHSHRSSRSSNRRLVNRTDVRASSQNRPTAADTGELTQTQKINVEAMQANQQVQDIHKSMQALPNKLPKKEEEVRQSGTGTAGYKRPQGYVKKALQNQTSKSALDPTETSQERQGGGSLSRNHDITNDTNLRNNNRDISSSKGTRAPNFRANSSIMSDSKRQTNYSESKNSSGSKKQAFFSKHKGSIGANVLENVQKKKENSQSRGASRDRLYNQETIASILKRNPELAYGMKDKKPPAAPPRRPKKKIVKPPTPEPPKEDPPEEPLVQSPRVLQLPIEAGVPNQESYPTNLPLPMTLPEEPPAEPQAFIMPNLFCPVDPDTPYNFEIEPREEELHFAPIEPLALRLPIEPDDPPYPERMIKSNVEDFMSERLEEPEIIKRFPEPNHDDEPMLPYPKQTRPIQIPPAQPTKDEPKPIAYPEDPDGEPTLLTEAEPERHFMTVDDLFRTHEMSVQCDPPPEDPAEIEETKEESKQEQQLSTILEEPSDEDNFSVHSCEGVVGKVTIGIQTNEAHFRNVTKTEEFQRRKKERIESTDWALSPIFDDIAFAKEKKTIGGRKLMSSIGTQMTNENCGNQVEEEQILQEMAVQILSQIECEYNVDQLKRKMSGKDTIEDERLTELYRLGLNTLKALMLGLRLEKEWEVQIKHQYALAEGQIITDPDETIKLLTRNKKMYEAKTLIQRLLKMICQRDAMVEVATTLDIVPDTRGGLAQNIQLNFKPQPKISRESIAQIKRLSTRITSQINTLQEEHRIFKRPFILHGQEYLQQIQSEANMLEDLLSQKFYVDDSGTAGMQNSFKSGQGSSSGAAQQ